MIFLMILFINTAEQKKITVALVLNKKIKAKQESLTEFRQIEELLPLVDKLFKSAKIKPEDLTGVIVVSGPGGFTSVRMGVVTANIFGLALDISVAGVQKNDLSKIEDLISEGCGKLEKAKKGSMVMPFYDKEPNITKPKNRES